MNEYSDGSTLVEAITGKWHRLEKGIRKGTFLIEFSNSLLLNIHVTTNHIDVLMKDNEDIFRLMGDFSFEGLDTEEHKFMFHSLGIDHVHFNNRDIRVDNPKSEISTVFVRLSHDKKIETINKLAGH
ncbi:hypothetical protein HQN89_16985 [Paenibacillus frigoriresistens]|uniref:hypothetical protein n=1 Tax=Paenibacillus alginolyticus TaxID=59839 RepID=UPI0015660487|nr:hypothetical protein [Paenibacillus frigoriresistens]NRF92689.1 hypothetical protein [Paenibacillus frigoriresistens]